MKPISRGQGRSSVAAAAYRSGERLANKRDGLTHDYTRRSGVAHAEIVLPQDSCAAWALDREALWNAAEAAEKRKDARTAREFEIALPHELSEQQRLEAVRAFSQEMANRYGAAIDFAIHTPHEEGDVRNHHAHLMMTTRTVEADGLGEKTMLEQENKKLLAQNLPTTHMQLRDVRLMWEQTANRELARAGHDVRIDHRSHQELGLEIEPTEHMGVHATQMDRRGKDVSRSRLDAAAARANAELIRDKPEAVLSVITQEKSVFDRHDVARTLHRYIDNNDPEAFQRTFAVVMGSKNLVELQPEADGELARYSTREMVNIERGMADSAGKMAERQSHAVRPDHVAKAITRQDNALQARTGQKLSTEQRQAIAHVTGPEQLAAVVGVAGAGKSTMLAAARQAWEAQGYKVHGAALAGKAAEGLQESSGIQSRTLASYEYGWQNERGKLGKGDVLVIDEAGMIGSRQLSHFIGQAKAGGAKVVMVGDPEQLQAIGAGAPFRAITEQAGFAALGSVVRQREEWQREASRDFARHRTSDALAAYDKQGAIRFAPTGQDALAGLVRDYMADMQRREDGSRLALAHRRVDVQAINEAVRGERKRGGELLAGRSFKTQNGKREFAAGDRIVFLENNRDLAVKNGMLGTVDKVELGRITARLDGKDKRLVTVPVSEYAALDHGYATTIHKSQGATTDRTFVLASSTMDRHLAYVAMTRHRDNATLYAGRDEFKTTGALANRLGRARSKETTLDYGPQRRQVRDRVDMDEFFGIKPRKGKGKDQRVDMDQFFDVKKSSRQAEGPSKRVNLDDVLRSDPAKSGRRGRSAKRGPSQGRGRDRTPD